MTRAYRLMNAKIICVAGLLLGLGACKASESDYSKTPLKTANCLKTRPAPIHIEAGVAIIGSDEAYPEERSRRSVKINAFEIDAYEVTNAQFEDFVEATSYVTTAETPQEGFNGPGAAVFESLQTGGNSQWSFVEGANWRNPEGPESEIKSRPNDPVVQVSLTDARAYATWAGRRLPTEVEWEYAAKAGAETLYIWGEERAPDGQEKANIWQGAFPLENTADDGFASRAPIGCFEPNAFGLYDMIGNVWEWTDNEWGDGQSHVIKGGSFLCSENFCRRYRASARQPQETDFSTNHIGFRTVQ